MIVFLHVFLQVLPGVGFEVCANLLRSAFRHYFPAAERGFEDGVREPVVTLAFRGGILFLADIDNLYPLGYNLFR